MSDPGLFSWRRNPVAGPRIRAGGELPRVGLRFLRTTSRTSPARYWIQQRGAGLIEVLISLVIIAIGLLGLAALQGKAQKAEMESYQRSQALILLQDMTSRLRANRDSRNSYLTPADTCAATCTPDPASPTATRDLCEWANALAGEHEQLASQSVGAVLSGCGCITGAGSSFEVTVAWQGLATMPIPETTNTCGSGITNRRLMSVPVRFFDPGS